MLVPHLSFLRPVSMTLKIRAVRVFSDATISQALPAGPLPPAASQLPDNWSKRYISHVRLYNRKIFPVAEWSDTRRPHLHA